MIPTAPPPQQRAFVSHYRMVTSGLKPPITPTQTKQKKARQTIRELKAAAKFSVKEVNTVPDVARDYQQQLFEMAKDSNIIAVMDTGMGKTLIAGLLIKHMVEVEHASRLAGGKKRVVAFLVPTVPLVFQQQEYLRHQIAGNVVPICGELLNEKQSDWEKILKENDVLCATPQTLVEALIHAFINIDQICLIVFDEAHHALGDHPYAVLMKEHVSCLPSNARPRILGLTASPVNSDSHALIAIENLQKILDCRAVTVMSEEKSLRYAARAKPEKIEYPQNDEIATYPRAYEIVKGWSSMMPADANLTKVLKDGIYILKQLGSWACARSILAAIYTLQKKADRAMLADGIMTSKVRRLMQTEDIRRQLLEELRVAGPADSPALSELSPKVVKLIEILEQYRDDHVFSGIVFVQRRETAERLRDILCSIDRLKDFLRVDVLVGHGGDNADVLQTAMRVTAQQNIVQEFGHNRINLLVATKVAEEGLDIRVCKLVIRFDMGKESMNLVNFIQSRGRARAPDSRFILMCEEDNWEHLLHLRELRIRESEIRTALVSHENNIPTSYALNDEEEPLQTSPYTYTVENTGAKATLTSALQLVEEFCTVQLCDQFVHSRPEYALTHLASTGDERFQASVTLPNCVPPEIRLTVGRPMRSKALAFRHAAWEAVKLLHQRRYLNDTLRPARGDILFKSRHDEEGQLREELQKGLNTLKSKRNKRFFRIKQPQILHQPWDLTNDYVSGYLNVIEVKALHDPPMSNPLGFLTVSGLPISPMEFSLWPNLAEVTVRIQASPKPLKMTLEQYRWARAYNHCVLSPMLKHTLFKEDEDYAFLVVPLRIRPGSRPVDFQLFKASELIDWKATASVESFDPEKFQSLLYKPDVVDRVVVDMRHWGRKFRALELCADKGPFDPVPFGDDKFKCAADYYQLIKNRRLIKPDQPVIRARLVTRKFNMLAYHNIAENESVEAKRDQDVFLLPQYCQIYPIDQNTIKAAVILPSILYYVELACRTSELQEKLSLPAALPQLITALSAPSATLQTNYERYETLGDAFLKLAITLHIYVLYPHRGEGVMTMMTHSLLSNYKLFVRGWKHGIPGYIVGTKLSRTEWAPMKLEKLEENAKKEVNKTDENPETGSQLLSDKQIADTVESILGACLDCSGVKGAAQALRNIYSDAFLIDWAGYIKAQQQISEQRPKSNPLTAAKMAKLQSLQDLIHYQFKDPMLLMEALTHPSSKDPNVLNYQRLEFLGDAVLGLLAVRYFFYTYPDLPPGRLSDLKDAAVNNSFLACVSANLGLHTFIEASSVPLAQAIGEYCTDLYEAAQQHVEGAEARQNKLESITHLPEGKGARAKLQRELEAEMQYWINIETPKAVSDLFEAILGAIFQDGGYDVEVAWGFLDRFWLPWVNEYIQPQLVGRHPFREMAMYMRSVLGCDKWRVPTKHDLEEGLFVANLIMHENVIAMDYGPSRKAARRALAENVLQMIEEGVEIANKCDCGGIKFVPGDWDEEPFLEKDEASMHLVS
ncbi:uncharacterized protein SPPG_04913 [Spizellomyces punctatus DAOM BR117]|uniref:Dicer-like protein 1 n=1 Tax=Spizellomyces punctatus (strain DAOM BR117) TaxID=645134 RepID=A0A0L0HEJ8_SPIPD|nr:uncharacterized protein SPPG_04913 [Spizellomyces punctatus DAOM BR117]KNC99522.1 hypothetical protein SPPG_04913 [Spizellomyces punctatus DAOM BR117]|eukprot:XP_016607562.1 hypothetical protein SPPG_04913 [Spizellomyces punctatus DAOM BR117]